MPQGFQLGTPCRPVDLESGAGTRPAAASLAALFCAQELDFRFPDRSREPGQPESVLIPRGPPNVKENAAARRPESPPQAAGLPHGVFDTVRDLAVSGDSQLKSLRHA